MDYEDLRAEYAEEMWVHRTGAQERYCINPKCRKYHHLVWAVPHEDKDTGQHWEEPECCKACGMSLNHHDTDPYEIISEDYEQMLVKAIKEKDWESEAYRIYQRILDLWESTR